MTIKELKVYLDKFDENTLVKAPLFHDGEIVSIDHIEILEDYTNEKEPYILIG